jgi:hypothetical protein
MAASTELSTAPDLHVMMLRLLPCVNGTSVNQTVSLLGERVWQISVKIR